MESRRTVAGPAGARSETDDEALEASGFFLLRTPLLPFDDFRRLGEDLHPTGEPAAHPRVIAQRVAEIWRRPEVREAVFHASPSLHAALSTWNGEELPGRHRGPLLSLIGYIARMAGRPIPFGLFAGITTGQLGPRTSVELGPRVSYRRFTSVDLDLLARMAEGLRQQPSVRRSLTYHLNQTLHRAGNRWHLITTVMDQGGRSYRPASVAHNPELERACAAAEAAGATWSDLVRQLVASGQSEDEAATTITALIDRQVLVPELSLALTGDDPPRTLIAELRANPALLWFAEGIDRARQELATLDSHGVGASADDYSAVHAVLHRVATCTTAGGHAASGGQAQEAGAPAPPHEPAGGRLLSVDLVKPALSATVTQGVVEDVSRGVWILRHLASPDPPGTLARFAQRFVERYGSREVPLLIALTEEAGVGYEDELPLAARPLLAGLPGEGRPETRARWTERDRLLRDKIVTALGTGSSAMEIGLEEIERVSDGPLPLPDSLEADVVLAASSAEAVDAGGHRVWLRGVGGTPGIRLASRFCRWDTELHQLVRHHVAKEEALCAGAAVAEIVHLPTGTAAGVAARPLLRHHEIPCLGRSGASASSQIPLTDLLVSVAGDRIVVRSRSRDCPVITRLSTAHEDEQSPGVHRFLCDVQRQNGWNVLMWSWGALEGSPFLPRVTSGRLVLSRATWTLGVEELRRVRGRAIAELHPAVLALREQLGLPRFVSLVEGQDELLTDLDNILSVEGLCRRLRGRTRAAIVEAFPDADELWVRGPEGRFVSDLIIPFVRHRATTPPSPSIEPVTPVEPCTTANLASAHRMLPGSEWLYARLTANPAALDATLRDVVLPVARASVAASLVDRWFFLRYPTPRWHLRVRLHGDPGELWGGVVRLLSEALEPLDAGPVHRFELDTYEREVRRYGGEEAMTVAESIFHRDSEVTGDIVCRYSPDAHQDDRWLLTLVGIHLLLVDFRIDLPARRAWTRSRRDALSREVEAPRELRTRAGDLYRTRRDQLGALVNLDCGPAPHLSWGIQRLLDRSASLDAPVSTLRALALDGRVTVTLDDLLASLAHMHVNRMLPVPDYAQELILYELLDRVYLTQLERGC